MAGRFDPEIISSLYGFYSFKPELDFVLEECGDLADLLGYAADTITGSPLGEFISLSERDGILTEINRQLEKFGEIEILISFTHNNGDSIYVISRGRIAEDWSGNKYVCAIFMTAEKTGQRMRLLEDMADTYRTKLSQNEKRIGMLQTYAEQDSLTRLLNAGTTRTLAEDYISETKNCCAMLIIDFDDFKHVNDRYGHMFGDEVLVCSAEVLKKQFRVNDIVGRIGGEEFLVLMKDVCDRNVVALKCAQIIKAINELQFDVLQNEQICCSVGAAISISGQRRYDELFLCADEAMYCAKRSGGNQYDIRECE